MRPKYHQSEHFKKFWQEGNGKELLDFGQIQPIELNEFNKYAHLFHQVDILGDDVVRDTYLKMPYHEASSIIQKCAQNPVTESFEGPDSLKRLFQQMQHIPDWYDEDLAKAGARFNMRTGTNALMILRDFSLMGGYDFAYLNKPLIFTGALKKGAVKRLKDTLEFWVHVTRENALNINSEAYQLIVRTRLMHSYSRLTIKKKIKDWDFENWGEPLNSWDMIATYTGFTLVFMQGLRKLGISISAEEEKGVYHLWKYIGYLLGIPENYLPDNNKQAIEQFYLWTTLQGKGDEDSVLLARALLEENLTNTIYKFQFQRKLLLKLHQSMNWHLLDAEVNERLQIPKVHLASVFPKIIIFLNKISEKIFRINTPAGYNKMVQLGHKQQIDVLDDYLEHTPKDFHY